MSRSVPAALPRPREQPVARHLGRWGLEPLRVLEEGAALGPVFELRLWRRAVVGYRPDWNRLVLRDLQTFGSRGSLSRLTPYLNGGVVLTDPPTHAGRRRALNPHVDRSALADLGPRLSEVVARLMPAGRFDALEWSSTVVRRMLDEAFFGGRVGDRTLRPFLRPLDRPMPHPFVPRPARFARLTHAIERSLAAPAPGTITGALAGDPEVVEVTPDLAEEIRIALAAGYDTTAHTLAWLIWHVAGDARWRDPSTHDLVINETLRLAPAGWIGSRVTSRAMQTDDVEIPRGTLVLYSPYLSHRDPTLWDAPLEFRPERFAERIPAWGYLPFSAGERTCLGVHLARLLLRTALGALTSQGELRRDGEEPRLVAGLTLRPDRPVRVERLAR